MLACEECDRWFHGECVGVTEAEAAAIKKWVCKCVILPITTTTPATEAHAWNAQPMVMLPLQEVRAETPGPAVDLPLR